MRTAGVPLGLGLVLLSILAGCSDGSREPAAHEGPSASYASFGEIAGLVTDDELNPLPAAEVGLRGEDRTTRTDDMGAYRLSDVAPGRYVVDAAHVGFAAAQQVVDVVPGMAAVVDFRLARLPPTNATFTDVTQFTGFYDCAVAVVVWVSACSYPYTAAYYTLKDRGLAPDRLPSDVQNNTFRYNFTMGRGAVEVVSEMVWQSTTAAGKRMMLILSCGDYDPIADDCGGLLSGRPTYARVHGESPLLVKWNARPVVEDGPVWVMSRGYLPFSPPQVALQQRFEMWNSVFYNGPAPDGYSLGNAGLG